MRASIGRALATLLVLTAGGMADAQTGAASPDLKIISVDVEGGAAVLIRTPEGKSLLIDTGWKPGEGVPYPVAAGAPPIPQPISADRIAAAAAGLGVGKIDYLVMTHYHADHLGGLEALLARLPVGTFVDHGPNREIAPSGHAAAGSPEARYPAWLAAAAGHPHISVRAGQTLDIGSLHILFVASDGEVLDASLPEAGQSNPQCAGVKHVVNDGGDENNRSLGMLLRFGVTRIAYLGDLSWNKEIALLCPANKVGKVDVYFVTGHGMNLSSSPPTAALDPLVAVMQNGPLKGGDQEVIRTVNAYPSLQGFWRTHATIRFPALNGDPNFIANTDEAQDRGYAIALDITRGGRITATNIRNQFHKTYQARDTKPR
ncbi:MAG: MBL fold metallo-hydrolase [Pseudomonadota bacterium]